MSFQYVIDNAETISITKRKKVAQTISRSGVVKATSIGGQVYEFRVQLPSGPRWSDNRGLIEAVEALDKVTVGAIQINNPAHSYISGYQGNLTNVSAVTVSYSSGNTLTITGGATLASGYRFKAGDFIQLGASGSVYSIIEDVAFNDTSILVHRPVREAAGNYTLRVGQNVSWNVICVDMPTWTIFGYDQVSWSGSFVFVEAV
jgi:Cu/Ag efflux pump CusA